jgi:hypothetical protein
MKNLLFIFLMGIFIISFSKPSYGQLNPINNLEWSHWYEYPNNFFTLSWEEPDASEDTLVGYAIYRNNQYYTFQIENSLYHTPYEQNCDESFVFYNGGEGFWIHVLAIYNSSHSESIYTDSVECFGVAIGIEEENKIEQNLFPNPTNGKLILARDNITEVIVYNSKGEQILRIDNPSQINLSNFPKGVYIVKLVSTLGVSVEKVIRK